MSGRFKIWLLAAVFAVVMCQHSVVLACPTCKAALGNDPASSSMVQGYFWSILFMMSMPFLIFGGLSAYFYFLVRRARIAQAGLVSPVGGGRATEHLVSATKSEAVPA